MDHNKLEELSKLSDEGKLPLGDTHQPLDQEFDLEIRLAGLEGLVALMKSEVSEMRQQKREAQLVA